MFIITGTPRSGQNILSQALHLLGLTRLVHSDHPDPATINALLFQDLGLSPYTPAMPRNWLESNAAAKAKELIHRLLCS